LFRRILSASLACVPWECDKKHLGASEDHTWSRVWLVLLSNILLVSVFGEFWCRNMNMDPILEVEEEEESASPYSPPMVTLMAQESEQITMEVSRRETFDQLRVDKRQSEIFLQKHIQKLELREDERRRRRSSSEDSSHGGRRRRHDHDGGGRRNQLPQRQPLPIKIPKFKAENDPNLYIELEQKVDQIF